MSDDNHFTEKKHPLEHGPKLAKGKVLPGAYEPAHRDPHVNIPWDKAAMDRHLAKTKARQRADRRRQSRT